MNDPTTVLLTFRQIVILFIFISAGYLMKRTGRLPEKAGQALAALGTFLFFPLYMIDHLRGILTIPSLKENGLLIAAGCGFLAADLGLAFLLALLFKKAKLPRGTMLYIFAFANYGYFGYPVMEGVEGFGSTCVSQTILFGLSSSISIASLGYYWLAGSNKGWKQIVFSPTVLSIVIGAAIGLSGLPLPPSIEGVLKAGSACMSPTSMLLTGVVLGTFPLKELLKGKLPYLVALVRLIVIPLFFGTILYLAGVRGVYFAIPVLMASMPIGMNTVLFPESAGLDSSQSARVCFVSYLFGIVTVPLWFSLVKMLM